MLGTYNGITVNGSLANTRIISIVSGGVLFGSVVGVTSGIISGFHKYTIDIGGITSILCFIASMFSGILSGFL
ncbi:MAG: LytS/YhcK type 5TM receptor domain-containing protein [Romboutsia sp.]